MSALAGFYSAGWRVNDTTYKPHFSLQYAHASGDGSAKDGTRHTFDQIYPYGTHDMFGLADPGVDGSYMNRSKYTENFINANILNLPEYASSTDLHFDAVRPMNHSFVIPAGYVAKQSIVDVSTPSQVGPDANQVNLWSLK